MPAKAQTAVAQVIEALEEGIKNGRFAPGQRLVEADLTRLLGVSRGPLREALGRLASEGVIEIEPYRGAVVRRMSRRNVQDLYEVRTVLEGEAACLAAKRIEEGDHRRRLQAAARAMDRLRGPNVDPLAYLDHNSEFHDMIVELSENKLLAQLVSRLQTNSFRLLFRNLLGPGARDDSIRQHNEVVKAILAGNERAAEQAMRRHVRLSGETVQRLPDSAFG